MAARPSACRLAVVPASLLLSTAVPAGAINIVLDYTYDTQNFFGAGNPDGAAAGAQAKAALEAAAQYFTDLLEDEFTAIMNPPQYNSQAFNGQVTWDWSRNFTHPGTGGTATESGPIAANEYRVYAGGRSLTGNTLGRGGPGGFSWSSSPSGGFTQQEINEIQAITDQFESDVETRGQGTGWSRWGGSITFDNDSSPDWHYDHTTEPTGFNTDDFFSVALHELGHALGMGTSSQWNGFLSGGNFTGANAVASFGGPVPADTGHWDEGVTSVVYGTSTSQEAAMDPTLLGGTRKLWTDLDAAAMRDLGWEVAAAMVGGVTGDYDDSGQVEQGDLDIVLQNWGTGTFTGNESNLVGGGPFDGTVDQNELDGVLQNWGSTSAPDFAGAAVPEPASAGALAALAAGLLARRRK